MKLWSRRFSIARGYQWKMEREVTPNDALEWLRVFEKDEPGITFRLAELKPRKP